MALVKCDFCGKYDGVVTTRLMGIFFHRECEKANPLDLAVGAGLPADVCVYCHLEVDHPGGPDAHFYFPYKKRPTVREELGL
jgi:hypothetical protein